MSHATPTPERLRTLEASACLLFLVVSLRALFSVLFGLFYDAVFAGTLPLGELVVILLLVLATFLAPLAAPRRGGRRWRGLSPEVPLGATAASHGTGCACLSSG